MLIEQAIFTSARTSRAAGYQLVARSPGVSTDDAKHLSLWGPSHGSLSPGRDEASSVNFHRLPTGTYCVSKTAAAGNEYSGRRGERIYTQFLLISPDGLARFANNPFALLRAAWAKGAMKVFDQPPEELEAFSLAGRAAPVDEGLLAQLADQWGPIRVAKLVAAAISPGVSLLAGASRYETVIGGLLNCFPVECRPELTFTTGLRFSKQRSFKFTPLDDQVQRNQLQRQEGMTVVDLTDQNPDDSELGGWASYVAEAITADGITQLASSLETPRPGLRLEQLDDLGDELVLCLRRATVSAAVGNERNTTSAPRLESNGHPDANRGRRRSDRPSAQDDQQAAELLEQLDDAVFDAVNGYHDGTAEVSRIWNAVANHLPAAAFAATREQYLRYTITLWEARLDDGLREPLRAVRALDVLSVLFEVE